MSQWGRRIRGALRMGLLWGFAWSFAGFLLARFTSNEVDVPFAIIFTPLGFISGVVFSGILAATEGRRTFEQMKLWRFAGWGATGGLLLTGIIVAGAAFRGDPLLPEFLLFGPPLISAGAACAAGSLALARRAERLGLPGAGAGRVGSVPD